MTDNIIETLTEVTLPNEEAFLKIVETLTRIGISNSKNELFQSCHLLQKRGKYYVVHFKRLFLLDGKEANLTEEDIGRENTIVNLLEQWDLLKIVNKQKTEEPRVPMSKIKVISYKDKPNYTLHAKYQIGKKGKKVEDTPRY